MSRERVCADIKARHATPYSTTHSQDTLKFYKIKMLLIAPIIQLPPNFTASTTEFMGQIFIDLADPLKLVFGILLAVSALGILISYLRK